MNCKFCDVPKVGKGLNATYYDMLNQIKAGLALHPELDHSKRLNIHFARMGEPTFNGNVLDVAACLKRNIYDFWEKSGTVHPVVSTMLPNNNKHLMRFLQIWTNDIKNNLYQGEAGLQFSINSTDDIQRENMFSRNALLLEDISKIGRALPYPVGRKYALNFALADEYIIDAEKLSGLFDNDKFMVKITPLHKTQSCDENGIITTNGYEAFTPYQEAEKNLKEVGFDVIVFVPSYDEDLGMITCGNAILSGNLPKVKYTNLI
jgi:23S rRNA (adenine2503-C2)-methyltransferase